MILIIIIWGKRMNANAFTAYDCDSEQAKQAPVSLLAPGQCQDPPRKYREPLETEAQVIQYVPKVPLIGIRCKVTFTRTATRCGISHHTYGSHTYDIDRRFRVDATACELATKAKVINIHNSLAVVVMNDTAVTRFYSQGNLDSDGNCQWGDNFVRYDVTYSKAYEETVVKVTVEQVTGYRDDVTKQAHFPLHPGHTVYASYGNGVLFDNALGTIVWEVDPNYNACRHTVSLVYNGKVNLSLTQDHSSPAGAPGDLVMVKSESTGQYLGIILKDPRPFCGAVMFQTQIKDLLIAILPTGYRPLSEATFKSHTNLAETDLAAQMSYAHLSAQLQHHDKLVSVWRAICLAERRAAEASLAAITAAEGRTPAHDLHGHGVHLQQAGAAAYVVECLPTEVTTRDEDNCTLEIPVIVIGDNDTDQVDRNDTTRWYYANPLSLNLQKIPTVVPCDPIAPIMWEIGGQWYCSMPNLVKCEAPIELDLRTNDAAKADSQIDFVEGVGIGPYSEEMWRMHRHRNLVLLARPATITKATIAAISNRRFPSSTALGALYDDSDISFVQHLIGTSLVPMYRFFGQWGFYLTAFIMIAVVLKVLAGCGVRLYLLYRIRGCGLYLLCAIWHTAYIVLTTPLRAVNDVTDYVRGGGTEPAGRKSLEEDKKDDEEWMQRQVSRFDNGYRLLRTLVGLERAQLAKDSTPKEDIPEVGQTGEDWPPEVPIPSAPDISAIPKPAKAKTSAKSGAYDPAHEV